MISDQLSFGNVCARRDEQFAMVYGDYFMNQLINKDPGSLLNNQDFIYEYFTSPSDVGLMKQPGLMKKTYTNQAYEIHISKISPTYPWKIPRKFHQQFMKEFLSLWGFGEVWGIFPGYVGKIIEHKPTRI